MTRKKIATFCEPHKRTSGQRFYKALCEAMRAWTVEYNNRPDAVLFNISAPLHELVKAKLRGQKIVLRVDGLWWDRISPAFLNIFPRPLRFVIEKTAAIKPFRNAATDIANFFHENYTGFARILLANHLVYQTQFCQKVHQRYFPKKSFSIILNGSYFREDITFRHSEDGVIKLFIIYSEAPAKGLFETLEFVRWLNEKKGTRAELHILGFNENPPSYAPVGIVDRVRQCPYAITYPPFQEFDRGIEHIYANMQCYLCFSYRDPCPNAVVESMAHGLPVVGIASGGVTEIVGDAGELLPWDDWQEGFFAPHRYEHAIKNIDFEAIHVLLMKVLGNLDEYRAKVRQRFVDELDVKICADKYITTLKSVVEV